MSDTCLVAGDVHVPHARAESVRQFLRTIKSRRPQALVVNGDLLDEATFSRFVRVPTAKGIMEELRLARAFLKEVRDAAPQADIAFVYGNHDLRLEKRLCERLPEAWGLISLDDQLGLSDMGMLPVHDIERDNAFEWHDALIGHFSACRRDSGATGMSLLRDLGRNVVQNHVHRLGLVYKTLQDRTLWAAEAGCLCDLKPTYRYSADWQAGAVWIEWDGKRSEPELLRY